MTNVAIRAGFVDTNAVRLKEAALYEALLNRHDAWESHTLWRDSDNELGVSRWYREDFRLACLRVLEARIRLAVMRAKFGIDDYGHHIAMVYVLDWLLPEVLSLTHYSEKGYWKSTHTSDPFPTPEAAAQAARDHLLKRIFNSEQWRELQASVWRE